MNAFEAAVGLAQLRLEDGDPFSTEELEEFAKANDVRVDMLIALINPVVGMDISPADDPDLADAVAIGLLAKLHAVSDDGTTETEA